MQKVLKRLELRGKGTTTNRRWCKIVNHISRFSLDRIFASVDTAFPDSGDVKRQRTESRPRKGPGAHGKLPGFKRTSEREVPAPRSEVAEHLL